jgi:phage terminase Nu1 subunit (DNA packaging protein)
MTKPKVKDDDLVAAVALARRLGLTQTSVSRLAGDGVLVRASRGRYRLWASVAGYVDHLRKARGGRSSPASIARAKLLDIQAKRATLAYELEQGQLVRADAMAPVIISRFRAVRDGVLSARSRIGARLPHLTRGDLEEIEAVLRETIEPMAQNKMVVTDGEVDLVEPA